MSDEIETNVVTRGDLREAGQALLDAAMNYWRVYGRVNGYAAVVWLKDTSGRMVVLTRGEYRQTLLHNIETLHTKNGLVAPFDDIRNSPPSRKEGDE